MPITLALGGTEGECFLHLPEVEGFAAWARLVEPGAPVWLQALVARSSLGELEHPGEVPVAGETGLAGLDTMLAETLGADRRLELLRIGLGGGLRLHSELGRGTRLEAPTDTPLAACLARFLGEVPGRAERILEELRHEAWTERHVLLQVEAARAVLEERGERLVVEL